jgi:hypothetical protein
VSGARRITIVQALCDKALFGAHPAFADLVTWKVWLIFLKATYGLPLDDDDEVEVFKSCTGRSNYSPPPGGWKECVCIVGRQAGKTLTAALIACYEAAFATASDKGTYCLLVAQDLRSSQRALFEYVSNFFEIPILAGEVVNATADSIMLRNGVTISAYPCRPESIRGLRAKVVVCDELAFYRSSDFRPQDKEMLRSARPCLANTNGRLIILSSPYGSTGSLWDLHRRHFGQDSSPVLIWQAGAPQMNPTLSQDYIARMKEEDPEAYLSEICGQFRTGVANLFDSEVLDACVVADRRELAPVPGTYYQAFVDVAGGSGKDSFSLAVGHTVVGSDSEVRGVVDALRIWKPPFNPSGVVAEAAIFLKAYGVYEITGDRYAGEWPREAFRAQNIHYELSDKVKSELYLELLPAVNSGRIEILDHPELLRELRGLERRRGASGKDRVDHFPGAHDDNANCVAGLAWLTIGQPQIWPTIT